jgi:glycosyltransferase involved in cell wall biosynthesis
MVAGKPLVATDVRGNRDLVEDGVNGFEEKLTLKQKKFLEAFGKVPLFWICKSSRRALRDHPDEGQRRN